MQPYWKAHCSFLKAVDISDWEVEKNKAMRTLRHMRISTVSWLQEKLKSNVFSVSIYWPTAWSFTLILTVLHLAIMLNHKHCSYCSVCVGSRKRGPHKDVSNFDKLWWLNSWVKESPHHLNRRSCGVTYLENCTRMCYRNKASQQRQGFGQCFSGKHWVLVFMWMISWHIQSLWTLLHIK